MKHKSLTLTSMLTAGVASLCCFGPLVAGGLGFGAFGAAAWFEELRPYLLGLTALLLVGAFYLSYRETPGAECADGSCAESPEQRREQSALLWLSTAAVVALAAFPHYSGFLWGAAASAEASALSDGISEVEATAIFAVEGMTCEGCASGMKATLEREEGVASTEVDYEKARARIRFNPAKTSVERLIEAIGKMGYTAKLTERPS